MSKGSNFKSQLLPVFLQHSVRARRIACRSQQFFRLCRIIGVCFYSTVIGPIELQRSVRRFAPAKHHAFYQRLPVYGKIQRLAHTRIIP